MQSFTFDFQDSESGISYSPTTTTNTGEKGTDNQSGLLEFSMRGVIAIILSTSEKSGDKNLEIIDYLSLAREHSEIIQEGRTSVEIAQWIGYKLNILSWKNGEFFGERKVLSSPKTPEEMIRLQKFVEALGLQWTKANGPAQNHPQYLLLDVYIQNKLFGEGNMLKIDERIKVFAKIWKMRMWQKYKAQATYIKEQIGFNIKGNWWNLIGERYLDGSVMGIATISVSGSFAGPELYIAKNDCCVTKPFSSPTYPITNYYNTAHICFLA